MLILICLINFGAASAPALTDNSLNVSILSPHHWDNVTSTTIIEGTTDRAPKRGEEYIWIAVNPIKSPNDWWPQNGGPVKVFDGNFAAPAYLGGTMNDTFTIVVLVVDSGLNIRLSEWLKNCKSANYFPPITKEDAISNVTVSEDEINDHIVKGIIVKLKG
jgi:hypothetical protein